MPRRPSPAEPDDRRLFLGLAALGLAGGALAPDAAAAEPQGAASIQGLFPAGAPAAAPGYSPGIQAAGRRIIFVSGQGPDDLKADMETQIRQTFDRIGLVLRAGGATFKNVVMLRAYFLHLKRDLPVYRKVRTDYLVKPYPASTSVGVTELAVADLAVEIEAVAVV